MPFWRNTAFFGGGGGIHSGPKTYPERKWHYMLLMSVWTPPTEIKHKCYTLMLCEMWDQYDWLVNNKIEITMYVQMIIIQ